MRKEKFIYEVRVNSFDEKKIFDKQELNRILNLLNNKIITTGIRISELLASHRRYRT